MGVVRQVDCRAARVIRSSRTEHPRGHASLDHRQQRRQRQAHTGSPSTTQRDGLGSSSHPLAISRGPLATFRRSASKRRQRKRCALLPILLEAARGPIRLRGNGAWIGSRAARNITSRRARRESMSASSPQRLSRTRRRHGGESQRRPMPDALNSMGGVRPPPHSTRSTHLQFVMNSLQHWPAQLRNPRFL